MWLADITKPVKIEILLFEQKFMKELLQHSIQFQQWAIHLFELPDDWDILAHWQQALKRWNAKLKNMKHPLESYLQHHEDMEAEKLLMAWFKLINQQLQVNQDLYKTMLDHVTKKLLEATPTTLFEDFETFSKFLPK